MENLNVNRPILAKTIYHTKGAEIIETAILHEFRPGKWREVARQRKIYPPVEGLSIAYPKGQ